MGAASKFREWVGMATKEDLEAKEREGIKKTGEEQRGRGKRGEGINAELCRQGNPEYCSDRQNGEIKEAVDKANKRNRAGSK